MKQTFNKNGETEYIHMGDVAWCECKCHTKGSEWNRNHLCKKCYAMKRYGGVSGVDPKTGAIVNSTTPTILESKKKEFYKEFGISENTSDGVVYADVNKVWNFIITNFQPKDEF